MRLKRLITFLLVVIAVIAAVDAAMVLGFSQQSLPSKEKPADAVIVLGAAPNSPAIRNRASKGVELYNAGLAKAIILTGGNTSSKDESEAMNMARFLMKGEKSTAVPLLLEEHSANTYENLANSRELIPGAKSILIVSDTYHQARAFLIAKRLGFADVYWASPPSDYYRPKELAWYYGREMVAILAYIPRLVSR